MPTTPPPTNLRRFLVGVAIVAVALFALWQSRQEEEHKLPTDAPPTHNQIKPGTENEETAGAVTGGGAEGSIHADGGQAHQEKVASPTLKTKIPGVKVRSLEGKVVFTGTVDVAVTVRRIEAGEKLRFSHDGAVFQNREGRLPKKSAGYYHEYVHPTPGIGGPGPQRIVTGERGEVYYTPDHYGTFTRLDSGEGKGRMSNPNDQ